MSKYDDTEDDIDSCVLVGTPLASLIPEDAKFTNKAKRPDEQIVTDEKGRQRFHGAFTGGFSAGYFNTVGTKEGFTPLTFKSSRNDRGTSGNQQRPEDFMDEEDFGEFGIAPKTLSIKSDFKDKSMTDPTTARKSKTSVFFDDLIRPVRSTVGVRMLKKMGWREGQGVGPKIKRKLRKLKAKKVHEPGRKIYGVTLPTENEISDIEEDAIDEDDDYLVSLYDVNEFRFEIKEDVFGLGYKRLNVNEIFSGSNKIGAIAVDNNASVADMLFPGMNKKSNKKRGMTGQAFGVGEYEDEEDDDLYKADTLENYDFDLDAKCEKEKKELLNKTYGFGAFENDLVVLKKFQTKSKKQEPAKIFKAPEVPKGFNLIHKFDSSLQISQPSAETKQTDDAMNIYLKSATERGEMLGESFIKPDSVFDLLSDKDKQFIEQQKLKQNLSQIAREVKQKTEEEKANENKLKKQKRYEQYLVYVKKNYKDPYSFVDTNDLTEWEKDHEKDEFLKTYQTQTKKIEEYKASMNSKFLSTAVLMKTNDNQIIESEIKIEEVKEKEASGEKKMGKATRVEYEWRPHNIVCKRFNVPNPYPDSKECGTIGNQPAKRTKDSSFSIFDVLTQQNKFESPTEAIDKNGFLAPKAPNIVNLAELTADETKIEFETKMTVKEKPQDTNEKEREKKVVDEDSKDNTYKNNVYLQDRPSIDIFKAIFDDDEEVDENNGGDDKMEEEIIERTVDSDDEESINIIEDSSSIEKSKNGNADKMQSNSSIAIIPSSLSGIDYKKLNKYLKKEDFEDKAKMNDFSDPQEYEKQQKEMINKETKKQQIYGPTILPVNVFKPSNDKKLHEQEIIKVASDSSNDDDYEFIEKTNDQIDGSSSDDSSTKKHKKKHHKKKNKKKSKKKAKNKK